MKKTTNIIILLSALFLSFTFGRTSLDINLNKVLSIYKPFLLIYFDKPYT